MLCQADPSSAPSIGFSVYRPQDELFYEVCSKTKSNYVPVSSILGCKVERFVLSQLADGTFVLRIFDVADTTFLRHLGRFIVRIAGLPDS